MSIPISQTNTNPRRHGRSVAAVLLGIVAGVVLSLGTDQVLHTLAVYPPWGEPMPDPGLNLLALGYRIVYSIVSGYITARVAPHAPMRHVLVGGGIGFAVCVAGAIIAIPLKLGPAWYPIALAVSALPSAVLGGVLFQRRTHSTQTG